MGSPTERHHVPPSRIRFLFSRAMSAMYASEVPLYSTLLKLVSTVNAGVLEQNATLRDQLRATGELDRLGEERHGAIRLGTEAELREAARFFEVMGMYPTGYYDLSTAGLPIHATCFRAHDPAALAESPFRMFVSLLRLDQIPAATQKEVSDILSRRDIFSARLRQLVDVASSKGGLTQDEVNDFIPEGLNTFKWQQTSIMSQTHYQNLLNKSPLVADVVAFPNPHINHLTPRSLDIDRVQSGMADWGIPLKDQIEGPPKRKCDILLRQTSFKAIGETVRFQAPAGELSDGSHTNGSSEHQETGLHRARFGEIEQRGAALTLEGRLLYDQILAQATKNGITPKDPEKYAAAFSSFPDNWEDMRLQGLSWFQYIANETKTGAIPHSNDIEAWIADGWITYEPIVYEDFLPASAAGIFQSNIGNTNQEELANGGNSNKASFQSAIDREIVDEMELYKSMQSESLHQCRQWMECKRKQ